MRWLTALTAVVFAVVLISPHAATAQVTMLLVVAAVALTTAIVVRYASSWHPTHRAGAHVLVSGAQAPVPVSCCPDRPGCRRPRAPGPGPA